MLGFGLSAALTLASGVSFAGGFTEVRAAADRGDATAQFNLGTMYTLGEGVAQDHAEAVRWYRLAAEQGNAEAQYNLGVMYAYGHGVPQNYAEAAKWYRLAAEQGNAEAQTNLGVMYANGEGVLLDDTLAHMWSNLAAARGNSLAAENRAKVAERMTREQIAKAQWLAREWQPKR
jgi:TPR repeat protein